MTSEEIQKVCVELDIFFKDRGIDQYQFFFVPDEPNTALDDVENLNGLKNTGAFVAHLHPLMAPILLNGAQRLIKAAEETNMLMSMMGMSQSMTKKPQDRSFFESGNEGGIGNA